MYPEYQHDIPSSNDIDFGKLSQGGGMTSDTCNAARKTRRLVVANVIKAAEEMSTDNICVLEVDCWNHLQNVWLGGMSKALSAFLNEHLTNYLEHIDPRLRVSTKIEMILRAVDKEFSLCANYPKGHGELFRDWMNVYHPGAVLFHVERTSGSRQDLCVEGAGAIYWNNKYWVEFLDQRIRYPGDNILEENLYINLTSCEMIAVARIYSIIHLSICLPTRWLAGNSHKLGEFDWSIRSMGRVVDLLEESLVVLENKGQLITDERFMMGIFRKLYDVLPPFRDYEIHMYEHKSIIPVGSNKASALNLQIL